MPAERWRIINEIAAEGFADFFLKPLLAAELDARAAFCLCMVQTGTFSRSLTLLRFWL